MHERSRDDRIERMHRRRITGAAAAPIGRDIGADSHSVDDSNRSPERASASEDECIFAGARANRIQTASQRLRAGQILIVTYSFSSRGVKKVQLQVRISELMNEFAE